MACTDTLKLIVFPGHKEREFFDLENDPGELCNLSGTPAEEVELGRCLVEWIENCRPFRHSAAPPEQEPTWSMSSASQ